MMRLQIQPGTRRVTTYALRRVLRKFRYRTRARQCYASHSPRSLRLCLLRRNCWSSNLCSRARDRRPVALAQPSWTKCAWVTSSNCVLGQTGRGEAVSFSCAASVRTGASRARCSGRIAVGSVRPGGIFRCPSSRASAALRFLNLGLRSEVGRMSRASAACRKRLENVEFIGVSRAFSTRKISIFYSLSALAFCGPPVASSAIEARVLRADNEHYARPPPLSNPRSRAPLLGKVERDIEC